MSKSSDLTDSLRKRSQSIYPKNGEEEEAEEDEEEELFMSEDMDDVSDEEEDNAILGKEYLLNPLVVAMMEDCLSMLCKVSNGLAHAFVKLDAVDLTLSNISLLIDYAHLSYIDVSRNYIRDVAPISNIAHLLTLRADNNLLTVAHLMPLPFLQRLSLANNFLNRAVGFNHPLLRYLNLKNNRLRSMTGSKVSAMTFLSTVDLSHNKLSNVYGLNSGSIRNLYLSHNRIDNLDGVNEIANVEVLHLRGNRLRSLDPSLGELKRLKYLNLRSNRLKTPESLLEAASIDSLKTLIVTGNGLARTDTYRRHVLLRLPGLQRLDKAFVGEEDLKEVALLKREEAERMKEEQRLLDEELFAEEIGNEEEEEEEEEEKEEEEEEEEMEDGLLSEIERLSEAESGEKEEGEGDTKT